MGYPNEENRIVNFNLADLNGETVGTGWETEEYASITYTFDKGTGSTCALTLIQRRCKPLSRPFRRRWCLNPPLPR